MAGNGGFQLEFVFCAQDGMGRVKREVFIL